MCVCGGEKWGEGEEGKRREEKGREGTRCRSEIRKEEKKRHEKRSFVLERETKMWARAGSTERNKTNKKRAQTMSRSDQCWSE